MIRVTVDLAQLQEARDELQAAREWIDVVAASSAPRLGEAVAAFHRARARVEALERRLGTKGGGSP